MKKTFIALALAASIAPAWAAEVVSSNIVGYSKLTLAASSTSTSGYTMIGIAFNEVGGETFDLNDMMTEESKASLIGGYGTSDADSIMVWNNGGYTSYYFSADDWSEEMGEGDVDADKNNKWLTLRGDIATLEMAPGSAAWFCRPAGVAAPADTITMAGEVPATSRTFTIAPGSYSMLASVKPVDFLLNGPDVDWTGVKGGYGTDDADSIQVWNNGGYTSYYFSADDWSEEMGEGDIDAGKNNKWLTLRGELVETPIDISHGFWFKRVGDSSLQLTFPGLE